MAAEHELVLREILDNKLLRSGMFTYIYTYENRGSVGEKNKDETNQDIVERLVLIRPEDSALGGVHGFDCSVFILQPCPEALDCVLIIRPHCAMTPELVVQLPCRDGRIAPVSLGKNPRDVLTQLAVRRRAEAVVPARAKGIGGVGDVDEHGTRVIVDKPVRGGGSWCANDGLETVAFQELDRFIKHREVVDALLGLQDGPVELVDAHV